MKIWYTYTIEISLAIKKKIVEIYKKYLQFITSLDYEEAEGDFEYTILLNRDWSYFYKKKTDNKLLRLNQFLWTENNGLGYFSSIYYS